MTRISVLTPCYDSARFIERTIESVQRQTLADWEMVIVDDGSRDDPASVVQPIAARDSRVRFVRQANGGVCAARNRAYAESDPTTDYLLFLDADDALQPTMLERLSAHLDRFPEVGMVYCESARVDADDAPLPLRPEDSLAGRRWGLADGHIARIAENVPETPFYSLFAWNGIVPSVTLIRRTAYAASPGFDEVFGQHFEETDLFFAIGLAHPIHYLPERLVNYRVHGGQAATQQAALWAKERKLYEKWLLSAGDRTPVDRQRIADAWEFREHTLMPRLRLRWAAESARRGKAADAVRQILRAVKHLRTYAQGRQLLDTSRPAMEKAGDRA